MANNKISTKSYALKRLKDSGYNASVLPVNVEGTDIKWIIVIDEGVATVWMIMKKNGCFTLYDGNRFVNSKILHKTESVEILISLLVESGIHNKHPKYTPMMDVNLLEQADNA